MYMNYFHHLSTGFYVDIGASSWKDISNTWFFDACLGWKGICVEADPTLAAALRAHRTCTVVNACVAEKNGTMALLAAGIQIGHVVPVAKKGDKGVVVPCHTMREILDANEVTHIDLLNLDIEDSEAGALATFPENDEVTVDVILIENEKGDVTRPPCFRGNVLRFPFFNRQYGLVNLLGDDIWVKLTKPRSLPPEGAQAAGRRTGGRGRGLRLQRPPPPPSKCSRSATSKRGGVIKCSGTIVKCTGSIIKCSVRATKCSGSAINWSRNIVKWSGIVSVMEV